MAEPFDPQTNWLWQMVEVNRQLKVQQSRLQLQLQLQVQEEELSRSLSCPPHLDFKLAKSRRMLLVALSLMLVLSSFLSACSTNPTQTPTLGISTKAAQNSEGGADFSGLANLVKAINAQSEDEALNLFKDEATLSEIDQVALMLNLHQNGWNYTYASKAEIKNWLEVEMASNPHIVPLTYKVVGSYLRMDGILYYDDQQLDLQLTEKVENGKISLLIYDIIRKTSS